MKVKKRKTKKNNFSLYMGIFITFLMVTSIFGVTFYGFRNPGMTERYNGYRFTATQFGFEARIDGDRYVFEVLPLETELIDIDSEVLPFIRNSFGIIITSNHTSEYSQDIALQKFHLNNLFDNYNKPVTNAFNTPNVLLPYISCNESTSDFPVIEFIENDNATFIEFDECIKIHFRSSYDLRRATGRIMFEYLGVIDATKINQ
ncbi:MAG: hypothetical protein ACMXYG_06845 [Candidatus Woesearchaeota archaeon]